MLVHAYRSSQVGEVMVIALLNNANLPETTLTNAKRDLISRAETATKVKTIQIPCQFLPIISQSWKKFT